MKPEFINRIMTIDCLEYLKMLDDKSVDFVLSDFPYNISGYGNSLTKRGNDIVPGDFGEWDKWSSMSEYIEWVNTVIKELIRVTKPRSSLIIFLDNRLAGYIGYDLERKGICKYKSPIILRKVNPIPHIRKTGFRSSFEHAIWLINDNPAQDETIKPHTFNFISQKDMCNVIDYAIGQNESGHPTEKPLWVFRNFIKIFSNENDIVLDTFMGSGTTAIASKQSNRRFLGCDTSLDYCKMANERLKQDIIQKWICHKKGETACGYEKKERL